MVVATFKALKFNPFHCLNSCRGPGLLKATERRYTPGRLDAETSSQPGAHRLAVVTGARVVLSLRLSILH